MASDPDPAAVFEFGFQLAVTARRWRRALDEALAGFGLTDATWRPLLHIGRLGEGVRQNDLSRSLGIEGPSLVRLLDRLTAAGLVERREDASDRRAKTLHFTPKGRSLFVGIEAVVRKAATDLVGGLPAEDLAACARAFAQILERTDPEDRS